MKETSYFFVSAIAIVIILIYGKGLIIPFIFALLLWFIVRKLRNTLDTIGFIKRYLPYWLKNLLVSIIMIIVLSITSKLLVSNINSLTLSYPKYESNMESMLNQIEILLGIDIINYAETHSGDLNFGLLLRNIFNSLTDLLGNAFIILIYALFIFLEETHFHTKLKLAIPEENRYVQLNEILGEIEKSITKYIGLKTLISTVTGVLSYLALLLIGIEAPLFWAFLIFILNFIPTIGSLVATLFPTFFCLLQFGEFLPSLLVLTIIGTIQVIIGNLLEPKLMGNSLNVSAIVTIFALSFWGAIWGITGMFLSVPITVIMIIAFSHFEKTKPIAILLSDKGKTES